jgi:hypothetical protein
MNKFLCLVIFENLIGSTKKRIWPWTMNA